MASETKLTIRLDEMKGWPGDSSFGIWNGGHLELRFNLTMSNFIGGILNLHLYAKGFFQWNYVEDLQLNGYILAKHWAFAGGYWNVEKDDWVEWEILPEYITVGENNLLINLDLSNEPDESEDFVVYGSSYLEVQEAQNDIDADSRSNGDSGSNGFKYPDVSPVSIVFVGLIAFTALILIKVPQKRMEIVIAIAVELLVGLILHFLLT